MPNPVPVTYPVTRHDTWAKLPHRSHPSLQRMRLPKLVLYEAAKENCDINVFLCEGKYIAELTHLGLSVGGRRMFVFASLITDKQPSITLLCEFTRYNFKDDYIAEPSS